MSGQKSAAEMNQSFQSVKKIMVVGACLIIGLVVSQCILFYRVIQLEDKMSTMQTKYDELSKAQPMQLRIRRVFDSKQNITPSSNNSNEYSSATQSNESSPSACELCKSICSSRRPYQFITNETSQRISCRFGIRGPPGSPGLTGPPGPPGPPGATGRPRSREYNFVPPRFEASLPQVVKVNEGQNLSLLCNVSGEPKPKVTWYDKKHARKIVENQRWLNKTRIQYNDTGLYECTASSFLNTIHSSVELLVVAKPRFVRRLKSQTVAYLGKTTVLQCMVEGYPKPVVTWFRMPPMKHKRNHAIRGKSLIIHKINKDDGGVYVCRVTSKFGSLYDGTLLIVRDIVDPVISPLPQKITLQGQNASASVACTAIGDPVPQITWYRGDNVIPAKNYVVKNKVTAELRLDYFKLKDQGVYKCFARNMFNVSSEESTNIVLVHCGDPGAPPNGTRIGNKYWFGESVFFSCNTGFRLKNSNLRVCLTNGNWSGKQPECVPVGKECTEYSWLRGRDRRFSASGSSKCDRGLESGWYRFSEEAGTNMLSSCVDSMHCGTQYPGWLVGPHPTIDKGKVSRTVCFSHNSYSSYNRYNVQCCRYSANITVRNCGEFYVYKLAPVPTCNARYCGAM